MPWRSQLAGIEHSRPTDARCPAVWSAQVALHQIRFAGVKAADLYFHGLPMLLFTGKFSESQN
jgi:hypothetical protein